MVHTIESACRQVGLEFSGWTLDPVTQQARLQFRLGPQPFECEIPLHTLYTMDEAAFVKKLRTYLEALPR